ncbi:LEAF RUST 10 DISEASE-RESISTANCE LOCUS RECEPTOR-LIKE PROTEIN KINASE-like 2.5 isoform X3 [Setaria italica]|uniref:Protein kinase domain-containing protein n=1 Tax=Setaria italica TaxID=4555 RepID=K3XFI8_SETIT|nr:LEAF RUST 10 DISEASE-RESISTANCE LOCUS RECEPTOR-LIKE PROTEIN KINASE-like 2.5 isoform X3 [Setaria italica]
MASALLVFLASSVWVAFSAPLMPAPAADRQGREHCPSQLCVIVNISFPFGLVPEEDAVTHCYALFLVRCRNNTPYLGYYQTEFFMQILSIFYDNASLLIAETQDHNDSRHLELGCYIPTGNATSKIGRPFSISPLNQNLIFYNCIKPLPPSVGLAETMCRNNTYVRVAAERYDGHGSYFLEGCNSTVVPVLARYDHANASNYEELISDGFLLTWEVPLKSGGSNRKKIVSIISMTVAASLLLPCIYMLVWHGKRGKLHFFLCEKTSKSTERNIEALIVLHGSLAPKRYKYSQVTKITSSFSDKLGEGGYGSVFKGRLDDGHQVAVKFLHDSKGEGEDFVNEVMSIGRTSHVNIVSLFGFCLEGSKRALIYEYMPNGSLDKFIYSESPKAVLGWDKLYTIAIGIARGLEYLHHSCNTRIVHFDIKPQNILLDEDFHPKVADFGLAKLCHTKESKLSMTGARGTVGFIAPEVHSRTFGVVSTKSDVYSYGMMLLEMVGGRKNVKSVAQKSSEKYFPHWIYDRVRQGDGLQACEVSSENEGIAKKMSVIGLWCIQILPMHRPTIAKVLEMFERGLDDLDMPPRQNFSQILEDPCCNLNAESTSTRSGTKTQVFSEVLKMKEMSVVNSKSLHRLPTL